MSNQKTQNQKVAFSQTEVASLPITPVDRLPVSRNHLALPGVIKSLAHSYTDSWRRDGEWILLY